MSVGEGVVVVGALSLAHSVVIGAIVGAVLKLAWQDWNEWRRK